MERINSNNVDIYYPDIYCPAEKKKGRCKLSWCLPW